MSCKKKKRLVKGLCFIQYVCSLINNPILILCFLSDFNHSDIPYIKSNLFQRWLFYNLWGTGSCTLKHTHTQVSMDAHSLSNTQTITVLLIVTQETDTFSGHEESSGEFVKPVLREQKITTNYVMPTFCWMSKNVKISCGLNI